MPQTSLSVVLQGKDQGLSSTIKNVQQALTDLGDKSTKLDDIQARFNKITNSSAPLKRQLRDIQTLMASMNLDGLDNTDLFTQMASRAGELADAMGDARTAVNAFANDNFKLEAVAQGLTLVASAGSIATGVMGMLGTENEQVTQAILKVQSALSILNGVQSIANILNKDSALMLKLKQIRMAASTTSTVGNTTATILNSTANAANTAAVRINNSIRQRLNTTIAIGKALMGDWTGLLIVGAAALTTYAIATADSSKELKKQRDETKRTMKSNESYISTLSSTAANLITRYDKLREAWAKLRTEGEKQKFLKDYRTEINNLGLSIKNVNDADEIFIRNSHRVAQALEYRARMAALASLKQEALKKYYEQTGNRERNTPYKEGQRVGALSATGQKLWHEYLNGKSSSEWGNLIKDGKLTSEGASDFTDYVHSKGYEIIDGVVSKAEKDLKKTEDWIEKEEERLINEFNAKGLQNFVSLDDPGGGLDSLFNTDKRSPKAEVKVEVDNNSVKYAQDQLKKFQDERINIPVDSTEALEKNQKQIDYWKQEVENRKIKVELNTTYADEELQKLQGRLKQVYENSGKISELNKEKERWKNIDSSIIDGERSITLTKEDYDAVERISKIYDNIAGIIDDLVESDERYIQLEKQREELLDQMQQTLDELDPDDEQRVERSLELYKELEGVVERINEVANEFNSAISGSISSSNIDELHKLSEEFNKLSEQKSNLERKIEYGINTPGLESAWDVYNSIFDKEADIHKEYANMDIDKLYQSILTKINARKAQIAIGAKVNEDDLQKIAEKVKELKDLRVTLSPDDEESLKALNAEIDRLEKRHEEIEIKLGLKPYVDPESEEGLEKRISELNKKIKSTSDSEQKKEYIEERKELEKLLKLEKERNEGIEHPTIYTVDPESFVRGDRYDQRQSLDNANAIAESYVADYEAKIIGFDEAKSKILELQELLAEINPELKLNFTVTNDGKIKRLGEDTEHIADGASKAIGAFNGLAGSVRQLSEDEGMAKAALIAQAIGQLALSFAGAMKGTFTPWDWIAGAISGAAVLTSLVASLQSFSTGGVVQGGNYTGDHVLARLNSGEGVLTRRGMKNLETVMANQSVEGYAGGKIEVEIDGTKLKGVLNNVNRKLSRQS